MSAKTKKSSELKGKVRKETIVDSHDIENVDAVVDGGAPLNPPSSELDNSAPLSPPSEVEPVEPVDETVKAPRPREFSFLKKNPDNYEVITTPIGEVSIPAAMGSSYWAVLKVLYERANEKVFQATLCEKVAEYMEERDPANWAKYVNKDQVKAHNKTLKASKTQKASDWKDRICGNAKTMTRKDDYGKRLTERGHCVTYGHECGNLFFILHTNLDPIKAKEKKIAERKAAKEPAEE